MLTIIEDKPEYARAAGRADGHLSDLYDSYQRALARGGFEVLLTEYEGVDAEVFFGRDTLRGAMRFSRGCRPGAATFSVTVAP